MRHLLRLFTVALAMLVSVASIRAVPAFAQEEELKGAGLGLDLLEKISWTRDGADAITRSMSLVVWDDEYCLPPDTPNKQQEEAFLKAREKTLETYIERYRNLRPRFLNAFTNDGKARNAILAKLPPEANPLDSSFWQPWQTAFDKARRAIQAKRDELKGKREKPCRPPPPPPPPPPPATPGVDLPSVEVRSVEVPATPARFCSAAEKQKVLDAFAAVAWAFYLNYQDAGRYEDAIASALRTGAGNRNVLEGLLPGAKANRLKHQQKLDEFHAAFDRAKAMPIVDCGGSKPQTTVARDAPVVPQPDYEMFVWSGLPDRFCTESQKQTVLSQLQFAEEAARRNYEKANAHVGELGKRLAASDRTPGLAEAQHQARQAATTYFNLEIELDDAYHKAQAMPVEDCAKKVGDARTTGSTAAEPRTSEPPGTWDTGLRYAGEFGGFRIAAGVGYENRPTQVYLGFENAAAEQTFAVEGLDDNGSFTALNGEVSFAVDPIVRYASPRIAGFVAFGFDRFDVDGSTFRAEIDPLGQKLLLPFVVTPGIALGTNVPEGTPGGANVVNDFSYRHDADQFTLYGKYGQRWNCDDGVFTGYAGVGYTNRDQRQSVRGSIPGFLSEFHYNTDIEVETWRLFAGLRYERPLFDTGLNVVAGAVGSLNFVDGRGRDRVNVSGFLNFDEQIDIKKSDTTFGYTVDVGIVKHIDDAALDLYLGYRHVGDDTTPVVVREDDGPSHLTFQQSDYDMVIVGATIRF